MPKFLPVAQNDYHELALFLSKQFVEGLSAEFWLNRFKFWWDSNPAFSEEIERGWLILADNKIAGFYGVVPTLMTYLQKERRVFNLTTWMVNPDYRSVSIRLLFKLINYSRKTILFDNTAGENPIRVLKVSARLHRVARSP